jgi:hypothetical protein
MVKKQADKPGPVHRVPAAEVAAFVAGALRNDPNIAAGAKLHRVLTVDAIEVYINNSNDHRVNGHRARAAARFK